MPPIVKLLVLSLALAGIAPVPAGASVATKRENVRLVKTVPGSTGGHAVVEGDRLYVGAYGLGFRIFDIKNPADPVQIGQYFPGPSNDDGTADPGARADAVPDAAVFDGRHIATLNGTNRTATTRQTEFLDVTDPAAPQLLWRFRGPGSDTSEGGEAHNGDIVDSRRLWLPGGTGIPNFRIYDLNPLLETPAKAPRRVFGGNLPAMWQSSPFRKGRPVGNTVFTHIHDQEIYTDLPVLLPEEQWVDQDGDLVPDPTYQNRDLVVLAEGGNYLNGNNAGSIFVVDITDPGAPVVRLRWMHGSGTDHHPWRYFHELQLLEADRHVGFVSDEDLHNGCDAGGVMSLRFSDDYTSATELDEWFVGGPRLDPASPDTGAPAPVCSAHVFSSEGSLVFMGAYNAGLQIIDFSDPSNLKRAGQYISPGANSWGALAHAGYIYVGDFGGRGLDVFEFIPDSVAEGTIVPNPGAKTVSGLNELACEQGREAPTVDGLMVRIPAEARGGTHLIHAKGSSDGASYDLNVYFHDEACAFMGGVSLNAEDRDTSGPIPEDAHYAFVANVAAPSAPVHVFAQITEGPPMEEEPTEG